MPQPRNTVSSLATFLSRAALTGTNTTPTSFPPKPSSPAPPAHLEELIQIFLQVLDKVGV